jgi:hypothetical protein
MERRLRYHFFFHDMASKVSRFVESCSHCSIYVDKKTKEPINHHRVPDWCWDTVAVDLFGPMPSSKHVVVVHDLASRFPAAKLVSSTKADKVIPALSEIYDTYGNPEVQLSDNGPPFNSRRMSEFCTDRAIQVRHTPPLHPNANPAETCMKPIGKAMKLCHYQGSSEGDALKGALNSYRQTPHPATGVPPANMMFRDGIKAQFPRRGASDGEIAAAKQKDLEQKERHQEEVNQSKYRKLSHFAVGDAVLVRNYGKTSKFHPEFIPTPYEVIAVDNKAKKITMKMGGYDSTLTRHPDNIERYVRDGDCQLWQDAPVVDDRSSAEEELLRHYCQEEESEGITITEQATPITVEGDPDEGPDVQPNGDGAGSELRRSTRRRFPNL